jgi:SMI1 / KNR4 family (SUKH-1)
MYMEHFIRAHDYLREQGLKPSLVKGSRVTEKHLRALDVETDHPMPEELRRFYLELGDGFRFELDESNSELVGWEPMNLSQHQICNRGFGSQIEEEVTRELGKKNRRSDPALLRQELERRKRWMPFFGFVGGGDYLCLDLTTNPPGVRFYEALIWTGVPSTWDFILASTFTEFVERWSRYHFLSPHGVPWTSFCTGGRAGRFDWAPEHFPRIPVRGD